MVASHASSVVSDTINLYIFQIFTIMIEYNSAKRPCKIVIPISGQHDLLRYQRGVLGILGEVELCDCEPGLKEDVKAVFNLLSHMVSGNNSLLELSRTKQRRNKKKAVR